MKGRPITGEEFDRMILTVPKTRPSDPEQWERLLTALWLSGLRLAEALTLSWDPDAPLCVCLAGRRPALRIRAEAQKSNRDEILPITPDFAEFLLTTPEAGRSAPVLAPRGLLSGKPIVPERVGAMISKIGKKAGVVVNRESTPRGETVKYASAHDLRRAFGTRWASRVKPAILQRLMRHADIQTTLNVYGHVIERVEFEQESRTCLISGLGQNSCGKSVASSL